MKTRVILCIVVSAVITLSFTFSSVKRSLVDRKVEDKSSYKIKEPVGGFLSEDKL